MHSTAAVLGTGGSVNRAFQSIERNLGPTRHQNKVSRGEMIRPADGSSTEACRLCSHLTNASKAAPPAMASSPFRPFPLTTLTNVFDFKHGISCNYSPKIYSC